MRGQHVDSSPAIRRGFDWLRLAAAMAPLVTAASFAIAWQQWGSPYAIVMAKTIQLEFLVIHAGLFIGVFIMMPIESALFRALRWVALALLALMYFRGGYGLLGWHGVLMTAGIFVGTYAGFLMAPSNAANGRDIKARRATEIGVRWFVSMLIFGVMSSAFGLPQLVNTWTENRASVAFGALYFAALALIESTPLYQRFRGPAPS